MLVAALLPFLAAAVDLFARCRRRRIPLGPALGATAAGSVLALRRPRLRVLVAARRVAEGDRGRSRRTSAGRTTWPVRRWSHLLALAAVGWLVVRDRLIPRARSRSRRSSRATPRPCSCSGCSRCSSSRQRLRAPLRAPVAARLALAAAGARRAGLVRAACSRRLRRAAAPARSFGSRLGPRLGRDRLRCAARRVGYVPLPCSAASSRGSPAGQLSALAARRYAPYPAAEERPPVAARASVRGALLRGRGRRRSSAEAARGVWRLMTRTRSHPRDAADRRRGLAAARLASLVWRWEDPSRASTRLRAAQLARATRAMTARRRRSRRATPAAERALMRRRATARTDGRREPATAIGRLRFPGMGVNMVLVNGTDHDTLKKGPGLRSARSCRAKAARLRRRPPHDVQRPVLGHRLAPRRRPRRASTSRTATFVYGVTGHRIVAATTSRSSVAGLRRSWRCRRATRASSRRIATSSTRGRWT